MVLQETAVFFFEKADFISVRFLLPKMATNEKKRGDGSLGIEAGAEMQTGPLGPGDQLADRVNEYRGMQA